MRVRSAHRSVGDYLTAIVGIADRPSSGGGPVLDVRIEPGSAADVSLWIGDRLVNATVPVADAPGRTLEAINRRLCFGPGPLVTVHAGVAARARKAVLLVGSSGAGKSTLVAALTRAGWTYLSDEAAGIDADAHVHPYARPIVLRPGSWPEFRDVAERLPSGHERFATAEWHIPATLLGLVADRPMPPGAVVEIRYEEGARAELRPIARGEALERAAVEGCNLKLFGQEGLDRLAGVVRRSRCYRLVFGDLAGAVASLDRLW